MATSDEHAEILDLAHARVIRRGEPHYKMRPCTDCHAQVNAALLACPLCGGSLGTSERDRLAAARDYLLDFLANPPASCSKETQRTLTFGLGMLMQDEDGKGGGEAA
jgi:hypothetical protein